MKKVVLVVAVAILLILVTIAVFLSVRSAHAQGMHVGQDVQCTLCWFEKRESSTASICESARVKPHKLSSFLYNAGQKLGQKGVEEWSFECNMGKKKVKGKFEVENVKEGKNNEGN